MAHEICGYARFAGNAVVVSSAASFFTLFAWLYVFRSFGIF